MSSKEQDRPFLLMFADQLKTYRSAAEEKLRYSIFQDNLKKIEEHNAKYDKGESSFKLGINKFADMTVQEFREMLGYQGKAKPNCSSNRQYFESKSEDNIPDSIDWSTKGAVTEVKDQASCGSCWSFSTTGTVEGQYFLKTGHLVSLSEQNLVDCDDTCYGCGGGNMDLALEWIIENGGIMTEDDYPYEGYNDICRFNKTKSAVTISSFAYVKENDENELKKAVAAVGPISVAIYASGNFQFYSSGILEDSTCGTGQFLNHAVLAVGYGSLNGKDYWIVKNSWGKVWGQNGYIWMSRNAGNQCGIAVAPVYPII